MWKMTWSGLPPQSIHSVAQVIFYIWHSHYISGLVADPVLASQAPVCSVLIYNPTRRQEVRSIRTGASRTLV